MTQDTGGLIISGIAIFGGLAIGAVSIIVSVPWSTKEKIARIEAKSKERLALLEKGVDPTTIFKERRGAGQDPLLWGFLLAGMGLGVLLGYLLHVLTRWDRFILTNSIAVLFGGLGLIVYRLFYGKPNDQRPV